MFVTDRNELNTNIDICLSNIPFLDGGEKKAGRIRSIDRSVWHQSLEIRHIVRPVSITYVHVPGRSTTR
jgi:hypothetical protein